MNAILHYAAFLSPVLVVAGLNLWLALRGEEGTLLFPSRRPFPAIALPEAEGFAPVKPDAANDDEMLKAA
jgi:hypothetical protein